MTVTAQEKRTVELFDKFRLAIPPELNRREGGAPGRRTVFITDKADSFLVALEEEMCLMDMRPETIKGEPTVSAQRCENDRYIHQRRTVRDRANIAFFHIELEDDDIGTLYLPGRMTAKDEYEWSDGVEPILIHIMNGITICSSEGGGK